MDYENGLWFEIGCLEVNLVWMEDQMNWVFVSKNGFCIEMKWFM